MYNTYIIPIPGGDIMKKTLRIICGALALCMLFAACGCTNSGKSIIDTVYSQYNDLAENAVFTDSDGKQSNKFDLSGKRDENRFMTVDLGEPVQFNTLVLKESGAAVTRFDVYASNSADKDYVFIYESDTVENGHACFTGDCKYRFLRVFVTESSEDYQFESLGVYYTKSKNADKLRVNAYLVMDNISESTDFSHLDAVTDLIIFSVAYFDENGDIYFLDKEGNKAPEEYYKEKVDIVKKAVGKRDINLIADIHMPTGDTAAATLKMLSPDNVEHITDNIVDFVDKFGFDGYDMDYEYPYTVEEWSVFNDFIRVLDGKLGDKILSLAVATWDLKFDDDVIEMIDRAEVMLYDAFDTHGYHAAFPSTANGVQTVLEKGFKPEQIDIGVPFYSRPVNRLAFWGSYGQFADKAGKYKNTVDFEDFDHDGQPMTAPQYINSYQMIADKAAFAIDAGIGGIMIWHYTCDISYDNENSLFRSLYETKQAKLEK